MSPVAEPLRIHMKQPIELQGMQVTAATFKALQGWLGDRFHYGGYGDGAETYMVFVSARGFAQEAREGDWVLKGVTGEFFLVPAGEFDQRYQAAPTDGGGR